MPPATRRNPYALFAHALTERDWVLADLIVRSLEGNAASRRQLVGELRASADERPAATPRTLNDLHRWAEISRAVGIDADPDEGASSPAKGG